MLCSVATLYKPGRSSIFGLVVMPILLRLHIYLMLEFPSNAPLYENLQGSWRNIVIRFAFIIINFIGRTMLPQLHTHAPSLKPEEELSLCLLVQTALVLCLRLTGFSVCRCLSFPLIILTVTCSWVAQAAIHKDYRLHTLSNWDLGSPFSTAIATIRIFGKGKRYEFIYVSLPAAGKGHRDHLAHVHLPSAAPSFPATKKVRIPAILFF